VLRIISRSFISLLLGCVNRQDFLLKLSRQHLVGGQLPPSKIQLERPAGWPAGVERGRPAVSRRLRSRGAVSTPGASHHLAHVVQRRRGAGGGGSRGRTGLGERRTVVRPPEDVPEPRPMQNTACYRRASRRLVSSRCGRRAGAYSLVC